MKSIGLRRISAITVAVLGTAFLLGAQVANGDITNAYSSPNGYVVYAPVGWKIYTKQFSAFRGKEEVVYVTQETDLLSRTTKYLAISSGSPEAVFGLSTKVLDRISKDELVDFYIDQETNGRVDYKVTKTSIKGTGDAKTYVIEANYAVPGYRQFENTSITFRNGKAYILSSIYLNTFSNFAPTLQTVADSIIFQ
jgi:hypothetical protein